MRAIVISDTHERHEQVKLPPGDMLIHCGDATGHGSVKAIAKFAVWMGQQDFKHKVFVPGNHDFGFENDNADTAINLIRENGITYLNDTSVEIEGLLIHGSAITPWFYDWAFNRERGAEIRAHWDLIPEATDVLITHGPPKEILDSVGFGNRAGCEELAKRVKQLSNLRAHFFGHLHLQGSQTMMSGGVLFGNAAICDDDYRPTHLPLEVELTKDKATVVGQTEAT